MREQEIESAIQEWAHKNGYLLDTRSIQTYGNAAQLVVTLTDGEEGAQALLRVGSDESIEVLEMDSVLSNETMKLFGAGIKSISGACDKDPSTIEGVPSAPAMDAVWSKNKRIAHVAREFVNALRSDKAPCTDGGNLACAWAVNYVVKAATKQVIGPVASMLSTALMRDALDGGKGKKIAWEAAGEGDLVISPTTSKAIGHVGILIDQSRICSNSSALARWRQNFNKESWAARYGAKKRLEVLAYRLT